MKLTHQVWKDLAGPLYDELVQSKASALAHLFDADRNVRLAAINICAFIWKCSTEVTFVNSCRRLAVADPDASVRVHAIYALGGALESSQERSSSRLLADIVKDDMNPEKVRMAAYWALREIQLGIRGEDFIKRLVPLMKEGVSGLPTGMTEEEVKVALLCGGRYPEAIWNSPEQIDWRFVDKYASRSS